MIALRLAKRVRWSACVAASSAAEALAVVPTGEEEGEDAAAQLTGSVALKALWDEQISRLKKEDGTYRREEWRGWTSLAGRQPRPC